MIIALSGMMASGKSTLANKLSSIMGYPNVNESPLGLSYLDSLFSDPSRWAYEAQSAFLIGKFECIINALKENDIVFLDRSMEEDAKIFFEYFHTNFIKDERSRNTYYTLLDTMNKIISVPTIQLICDVSLETAKRRINQRDGKFKAYFSGHIEDIYSAYHKYNLNKKRVPGVYYLNSEKYDWREELIASDIASDIDLIIKNHMYNDFSLPQLKILKTQNKREVDV